MKKFPFLREILYIYVYEGSFERDNSQQSKCDAG